MKRTNRVKYFSKEEAAAFLDALEGARDRLAFHLLYHYGLRVGELAKLRMADFRPSVEDPREVYVKRLKSGISRHYPVRDDDRRRLREWLRERGPDGEWLFPSGRNAGRPLTTLAWQKAHRRYAAKALPPDRRYSIHAWRHSAAVHLLLNGADVKLVKDWLGHAELENTMIYVDLAPTHWAEYAREALRRFER
jgi:type 1 fimbriae regulatory protein FimB/type 1 fimbriae regulatory protein FimE